MKDVELKPCPFCGGKAKIVCCDDEGNIEYDPEYEKSPWSGLGYRITHSHGENINCPIAEYGVDEAFIGVFIYDTEQEAAEAWNRRADNG